MKAETYLAQVIRAEVKKSAAASKQLARKIVASQVVREITEGPAREGLGRKSYAN